jgi:putative FmdB family regulatory protein
MPYYDLKCADCENEFNAKASMDARTTGAIQCPACGSYRLETIFRKVNLVRSRGDVPEGCPAEAGGDCGGGCCSGCR